ncbi:YbdK family carboxylate-amine ligase [Solirubrobacter sp. CPCC 204708]|uniref:Putative glutamate--cysteine ligase 2 n=1 Tax=Solirubrobacter deserti TaxID=2282478 RepID=A0ABT4RCE4_9ACTN|nr:YbdK family carboxylate-amine ligase [Solirubrobacter deserti]MBE2317052.1 YbdK family carboxylate-amine ligase [Solirubrobacter deserti]MDA0136056.1 YbdK family carboxylate-amine ligase [Solirubrobacter deserti]
MEHRFGRRPGFPLGIEEELLLVDAETFRPANIASDLVGLLDPPAGVIMNDLYEALIECSTPVVASAAEGMDALASLRELIRGTGAAFIGGGLHPHVAFGDVVHVETDRYQDIRREMRGLVSRTPTAALHVHVGMPDPETAIDVCNRMRAYLPLLQALAAHSPFWFGHDSGLASARSTLFRSFPRSTIPPTFAGWEHYQDVVQWCVETAEAPDYTYLWWDIRPSPRLGTIEVRAMDAQSRLESATGIAALVHALAVACANGEEEAAPPTEGIMESSFRAARDGLDATVWWRGAIRPMREVGADALALARGYASELHGEDALEEVERILRDGGGADRMRAAHAAGGMHEVLSRLAAESWGYSSTQTTLPS